MIAETLGWSASSANVILAILCIVSLFLLNAIFHAAESALSGLRKNRIDLLKESGDPNASKLEDLYENEEPYFAACIVGNQIARLGIITASVLTAPKLAQLISSNEDPSMGTLVVSILIVVMTVAMVNVTFAELLFRAIAQSNPERWGIRLFRFLKCTRFLFSPFVLLINLLGGWLTKRLGLRPLFSPPIITEEELREIVEESGESGELIEDEKEMIHSIMEFTDTVAREVMTPRTEIDAIDVQATPREVANLIEESGHSRIPIYEGTIDRIVGIVHAKDLLKGLLDSQNLNVRSIMRSPYFIPESKFMHQLLEEFRRGRVQMAIVQDEYGGTSGLVTIEDVVEEIVGEIVDEYDEEEPDIQSSGKNEWIIDGRTHIDDVNDEIGSHFDSEEFDTLGGFVFGLFGRQPELGESIDSGSWDLMVAETDGRRVVKVKATKKAPVHETNS